jgi:hypothetical protein
MPGSNSNTNRNSSPIDAEQSISVNESPKVLRVANAMLAVGGALCLVAALYLVRYGLMSDGPSQEMAAEAPAVHYLIPALTSVLLFASLGLRSDVKIALAVVLTSIGFSLYLAEFVLVAMQRSWYQNSRTLWSPSTSEELEELVRIAKKAGVTYDRRSKFEIVTALRTVDPGAVPAIVARALLVPQTDGTLQSRITLDGREVVALGGISKENTALCNESGEWVTYDSDEHGFHNPVGIWQRSVDIVIIGDSYAQGACVPSDKNSAAVIRARFPATLNLGMLGSGPLIELAQLQEYVSRLKPGIVLWFFYEGNDFGDLDNERNSRLLMSYLEGGANQQLIVRQPAIDRALRNYVSAEMDGYGAAEMDEPGTVNGRGPAEKSKPALKIRVPQALFLSNLNRRVRLAFQDKSRSGNQRAIPEESMQRLGRVFAAAKSTVDSWGGAFYLVYVPERDRYTARGSANDEANHARILELARALRISVIDIHSVIKGHDDPLSLYPFRRRGHFNQDGYRLVGETILHSITCRPDRQQACRHGPVESRQQNQAADPEPGSTG